MIFIFGFGWNKKFCVKSGQWFSYLNLAHAALEPLEKSSTSVVHCSYAIFHDIGLYILSPTR